MSKTYAEGQKDLAERLTTDSARFLTEYEALCQKYKMRVTHGEPAYQGKAHILAFGRDAEFTSSMRREMAELKKHEPFEN